MAPVELRFIISRGVLQPAPEPASPGRGVGRSGVSVSPPGGAGSAGSSWLLRSVVCERRLEVSRGVSRSPAEEEEPAELGEKQVLAFRPSGESTSPPAAARGV